MKEVERGW